jgi:2-dehydropantoate 2-reductase
MRIIVYGVGAIGGTVAAALAIAGRPVVGIARGRQLAAVRERGLLLRTPKGALPAQFPCVGDPADLAFEPDDAILLTMKSQDTGAALERLRAAGVTDQPVFCVQNAVANERMALRLFPNVHGVTVMMPAGYVTAGEVAAHGAPRYGIFDIGRYPAGSDGDDEALAEALGPANIAGFVDSDVMASKHGKLLMNLNNVVEAALGPGPAHRRFHEVLRAEAEAVLSAAGIAWRFGGSSAQSLLRGTGSIETDWLNGEIALLGRLHAVPTPANAWFMGLAARMARERMAPGSVPLAEVEAGLRAAGVAA